MFNDLASRLDDNRSATSPTPRWSMFNDRVSRLDAERSATLVVETRRKVQRPNAVETSDLVPRPSLSRRRSTFSDAMRSRRRAPPTTAVVDTRSTVQRLSLSPRVAMFNDLALSRRRSTFSDIALSSDARGFIAIERFVSLRSLSTSALSFSDGALEPTCPVCCSHDAVRSTTACWNRDAKGAARTGVDRSVSQL